MLAKALALRFSRFGLHYGWVVVAVTFVTTLVTSGAMSLPGALILPLNREFGWTTEQISGAVAVRILLYGLMAPFAASLIDRYGLRRAILSAVALIGVGLLLALKMTQIWHLVLLWGIVVGLGTGLTALVMSAIVATRWFSERRGLVLGILTASSATGQLLFLPLAAWIEQSHGWRVALAPTLIGLAVAGAAVLLFMANRPSDVGLAPYGESGRNAPDVEPAAGGPLAVLGEISGSGAFWILAATMFVCGLSTNGLIQTHFIALCAVFVVGAVAAASTLAMMGMFDFVGTIGSGWLSDRFDNRALLFFYYGLRGLSLLYLPGSSFSIYGLSLFAAFYGLDWVATVPPTIRLTAQVFGRERAGVAFGWIFAAHMIGASFAAYGAGYTRSVLQSYLPAFYVAGALCLVAASLVWLIEKRSVSVAAAARAPA